MKITVAAVQMPSEPRQVAANVERADALLAEAHRADAALAVLPELFNTGYGLIPDFAPYAPGGSTGRRYCRFVFHPRRALRSLWLSFAD